MNWREARLIGFDVETAGNEPNGALDPIEGRIVQLAFTIYSPGGEIYGPEYERKCGLDGVDLPPSVSAIHHIWPEDVAGKPSADALMGELSSFLADFVAEDHVFIAYNGVFDCAFIYQAFKRCGMLDALPFDPYRVLDPLTFARSMSDHNRLPELASRLNVPTGGAHEACRDVRTTIQVMLTLADILKLPDDFDELLKLQEMHISAWEKRTKRCYREILLKVLPEVEK